MPPNAAPIIVVVLVLVAVIVLAALAPLISLFIQAQLSNARIPMVQLIAMRLRHRDIRPIVYARIRLMKAGLDVPLSALEIHTLAGGHLGQTVRAVIEARAAGRELTWDAACRQDLAAQHSGREWSKPQRSPR